VTEFRFGTRTDLDAAGYLHLEQRFALRVLAHHTRSWVSRRGERRLAHVDGRVRKVYPRKYWPGDGVVDHLVFALKYDGINLAVLAGVFAREEVVAELTDYVRSRPLGKYARKLWYLCEMLCGERLPLDDLKRGNYEVLLNPEHEYTGTPRPSKRHRVVDNLLGNRDFCPTVRKSDPLLDYEIRGLDRRCRELVAKYPEELMRRALSYLFTRETRASFEIEREVPDKQRETRFVELLREAGKEDYFDKEALLSLQRETVDHRFADRDYRDDQNYVGQSVSLTREVVHYVSPKPEDVPSMMDGWARSSRRMLASEEVHPVVVAAASAFGFVFIHPFSDGNGRLHRFLLHHVLSARGFTPENLVFPLSATLLKQRSAYDAVLESFSRPVMGCLEYTVDREGRMTVLSDTADLYRYVDFTAIAERLFVFVEETIRKELLLELDFLAKYDRAVSALREVVRMPDRLLDLFIRLCFQNRGYLSTRKRKSHFADLTDSEVREMETLVRDIWSKHPDSSW